MSTQRIYICYDRGDGDTAYAVCVTHDMNRCLCGDECIVLADSGWMTKKSVVIEPCENITMTTAIYHVYLSVYPWTHIDIDLQECDNEEEELAPTLHMFGVHHINTINAAHADPAWHDHLGAYTCDMYIDGCGFDMCVYNIDKVKINFRRMKVITDDEMCAMCVKNLDNFRNMQILDIYITCYGDEKICKSKSVIRNRLWYYDNLVALCMLFLKRNKVPTNAIQPADIRDDYDKLYVCEKW